MNVELEKNKLVHLRALLVDKVGWGQIPTWTQRDFQNLSQLIFEKTHEQISVTTLKRVLGKFEYKGLPYQHTLDILCHFLGIKDWISFEFQNEERQDLKEIAKIEATNFLKDKKKNTTKIICFSALGLAFCLAFFIFWRFIIPIRSNGISTNQAQLGSLAALNGYSESVPHKVDFEYYIPKKYFNEQIVISFGEDGSMSFINIDSSGKGSCSHIYKHIGSYEVKIFSTKTLVAKTQVLLASSRWVGFVFQDNIEKFYQPPNKIGTLKLSTNQVSSVGIDTNKEFWSEFGYYKSIPIDGDNFSFETRLRSPANIHNHQFPKCQIKLKFETEQCYITFETAPNVRDIYCKFSDHNVPLAIQKAHFIKSIANWTDLKLKIKDKNVSVFFNGKTIYTCKYETRLGRLNAINLKFRGVGEIDEVKVENEKQVTMYYETF